MCINNKKLPKSSNRMQNNIKVNKQIVKLKINKINNKMVKMHKIIIWI